MAAVTGPSGGVLGDASQRSVPRDFYDQHPDWARELLTIGSYRRAGHDRKRWETVNWEDYRARVGISQRRGPWRTEMFQAADADGWVAEAEGMPHEAGWYTALLHDERGVVMSDLPAEIAGSLPFLDRVAAEGPAFVLIAGLGLGIVPAWLLGNTSVGRIDVIEIDRDVIAMTTGLGDGWRPDWAGDPRLHVYQGDAHTWTAPKADGCALHPGCCAPRPPYWDCAWFDLWDTVSASNLPSMHRLHRRFGRRTGWAMSWERAECEAMRARGQTQVRPDLARELDGWRVCDVTESGTG